MRAELSFFVITLFSGGLLLENSGMIENPFITIVHSDNFALEVLRRSDSIPVLVDFWADWCNPCKMLMPILDKLALEYEGKLWVAKIDTESEKELSTTYGIRSLPTAKIFRHGQVVDEFMGVLPEPQIKEIIDRHVVHPADAEIDKADQLAGEGDIDQAISVLKKARVENPNYPKLSLSLAAHQLKANDPHSASEALSDLPLNTAYEAEIKRMRAQVNLALRLGTEVDLTVVENKVNADPHNLDARLGWGQALLQSEDSVDDGVEVLIEVIQRARESAQAEEARETLVQLFGSLNPADSRVSSYRRQLARALH